MRQLPRIALLICAAIIVIVALLVSMLRLAMPMLNNWREPILHHLSSFSGQKIQASALSGSWENFGPVLEIRDLQVGLNGGGKLSVKRVTLALNVWQSLLHARWQFRQLTFCQLNLNTNTPLTDDQNGPSLRRDRVRLLFLRQFDHFTLHNSQLSFPAPSGQRLTLSMPELTWLNEANRHRAEGHVSLSSFNGQHGLLQVRMDLRDHNGLLNDGRIWMQADDVDVRPWLGQWMKNNSELQSARFSLAAWLGLKEGKIDKGDLWLKRGGASWQEAGKTHTLQVADQTAHLRRVNNGWRLTLPQTQLKTDNKAWPQGWIDMLWQPENSVLPGPDHQQELRLRATQLDLDRLAALMPLLRPYSPQLLENWQQMQPRGQIDALALDIPLQQPEQIRFQARWRNLSWQPWELLPAMEKLTGELSGSGVNGQLKLSLNDAVIPYAKMFKAPLQIHDFSGAVNWQYGPQGLILRGSNLDVQVRSVRARGDFTFSRPQQGSPDLEILAGISVSDARDAWRYFPEPLMGKALVHYLTGAIRGGQTENATLLFSGNPQQFPFRHHEGRFEVAVALREATFAFQPDWPSIQHLNIDLDFLNNGLWMKAPLAMFGNVRAKNVSATIPDYSEERLIIDGCLLGEGQDVGDYFNQTPLQKTVGMALELLPIGGEVSGRLHLDIPFDHQKGMVRATGDVRLRNNQLTVKPTGSTLENLTGQFRYDNSSLHSDAMQASWFGQPVSLSFNTRDGEKDFNIGVDLAGNWALNKLPLLTDSMRSALSGNAPWQGKVAVTLPHQGQTSYQVEVKGDLKGVSSHLPPPLDKSAGSALPVTVFARGDINSLNISGSVGSNHHFNSRWLPGKLLRVERGVWLNNSNSVPPLPDSAGMVLNLPPLDGDRWLELLTRPMSQVASARGRRYPAIAQRIALPDAAQLPGRLIFHTPLLQLAGQRWHKLNATLIKEPHGGLRVEARGPEIAGSLTTMPAVPWNINLEYLYYNPQWGEPGHETSPFSDSSSRIDFSNWPALRFNCIQCWLRGQNYGRVQANLMPAGDTLTLSNGLLDTGKSRLQMQGEWVNRSGNQRTSLKGRVSGKNISDATDWFGIHSPLRDAPFSIDYDLHWRSVPWAPAEQTLSGTIKTHFGAGQVADVDTGRTGQLLRLFSIDALMRRLRLDFSDTFSDGFAFDSINGAAWIEKGVMHTNNLLVDGLEADVAMKGKVDLVKRQLDVEAVVAPEISTTVGVAAAFAVNPVVGAAVFAASKVLGPLWSKISVLRYHISGPVDTPQIDEVLRKPREKRAK